MEDDLTEIVVTRFFFLYISFLVGQFGRNKIHYEDK